MTLEDEPCRWKVSSMLLGESRGQLLIVAERMTWLGRSGNDAQLWMCLVVKVIVRCCKEQYCIGTWSVRSMNQGKFDMAEQYDKSKHRHLRNQLTKMDGNGQI